MNSDQSSILLQAGTNEVEFIEFYVGSHRYGINVAKVKQVIHWNPNDATRLDQSPPHVVGTYYFRHKPILVIDLRKALNIQDNPPDCERQLLLVTEFNQNITGFLIDGVQQIHRKTWKDFHPMSNVAQMKASYVVGNILVENRIILIIDFEYLMAQTAPQSFDASYASANIENKIERKDIILIYAEDSAMIRKITMQKLTDAGFTNVKAFENGALAWNYLKQVQGEIQKGKSLNDFVHIVVTDIEMPQMDGLTLCRRIKTDSEMRQLPVIIYSSLINVQMAHKCQSVGADAYMSKPDIQEMAAMIDKFCLGK